MRPASTPGPRRVRPVTALALVALCMAGAAQASSPAPTAARDEPAVEPIAAAAGRLGANAPVLDAPADAAPVDAIAAPVQPVAYAAPAPAGGQGIPQNVLAAYQRAEAVLAGSQPSCNLRWYHLAGIGKIESGHARGGRAADNGETAPHILGPVLSGGPGIAAIRDTDGGILDGDPVWDRAVGPMQFIPSTWAGYRTDGNGDGVTSPHNIYDSAAGAGRYLCSGGLDLAEPGSLAAAVFRYNHSAEYVSVVMAWMRTYSSGVTPVPPSAPGSPDDAPIPAKPLPAQPPVMARPAPPPAPQPSPAPTPAPAPAPTPQPQPQPEPLPTPEPTTNPKPDPRPTPEPGTPAPPALPEACQDVADLLTPGLTQALTALKDPEQVATICQALPKHTGETATEIVERVLGTAAKATPVNP